MYGQPTIRLRLQGFSEVERQMLDSILALAELRLNNLWQIYDGGDADITILNDAALLAAAPRPCIYYVPVGSGPASDQDEGAWPLEVDENRVPRLRLLVDRLNEIASALQSSPNPEVVVGLEAEPSAPVEASEAPRELLDLLQDRSPGYRVLQFGSGSPVYIDSERARYYCAQAIEQMGALLVNGAAFSSKELPSDDFAAQVTSAELKPAPLSHLRWYVALMSPPAGLAEELEGRMISLKRWPDLGLPGGKQFIRLAAFLQSNVSTLQKSALKTNTPLADAAAFLYACDVEGLVRYSDTESIHEKQVKESLRDLLARISDRVNA